MVMLSACACVCLMLYLVVASLSLLADLIIATDPAPWNYPVYIHCVIKPVSASFVVMVTPSFLYRQCCLSAAGEATVVV